MASILVVEDNTANMTLAVYLLESAGHTVLSATDAEAGLVIARTTHPDLILMDIQLPGMDGLEATAQLKRDDATREIPVIALTALAYPLIRPLRTTTTPALIWLILATVPLLVDFSLGYFNIWANTHASRFITGALLSSVAVFYIIPGLVEIA